MMCRRFYSFTVPAMMPMDITEIGETETQSESVLCDCAAWNATLAQSKSCEKRKTTPDVIARADAIGKLFLFVVLPLRLCQSGISFFFRLVVHIQLSTFQLIALWLTNWKKKDEKICSNNDTWMPLAYWLLYSEQLWLIDEVNDACENNAGDNVLLSVSDGEKGLKLNGIGAV